MPDRIRLVEIREDPLVTLGRHVSEARQSRRGEKGRPLAVLGMAQQIAMSRQTLAEIEKGTPPKKTAATYRVVEDFFGWPAGSILRYLDETNPGPLPAVAPVAEVEIYGPEQTWVTIEAGLTEEEKRELKEHAADYAERMRRAHSRNRPRNGPNGL